MDPDSGSGCSDRIRIPTCKNTRIRIRNTAKIDDKIYPTTLLIMSFFPGHDGQLYWCRKQFYSLNCQFISDGQKIFAVDAGFYGSCSDARVWAWSAEKPFIEMVGNNYNHKIY